MKWRRQWIEKGGRISETRIKIPCVLKFPKADGSAAKTTFTRVFLKMSCISVKESTAEHHTDRQGEVILKRGDNHQYNVPNMSMINSEI